MIKYIEAHKKLFVAILGVLIVFAVLQNRKQPEEITYGVSFSEYRSDEMGVSWRDTFDASIDELGILKYRLASHWTYTEPERDKYDFESLDYQIRKLEEVGGSAILVLGRRQPGWPECHVPEWAKNITEIERQKEILEHIEITVNRYKDSSAVSEWQVENEPFLTGFAHDFCGDLDKKFLGSEIDLVHELDPTRNVLVTDSGNLGLWWPAYRRGDSFGTSVYRYLWNPTAGPIKSFLPPSWYRAKTTVMELISGKKDTYLIELSLEPWLLMPTKDAPLEDQYERMGLDKMEESIEFASKTAFETQYLWGVEWWYWLNEKGESGHWDYIKSVVGD
jgi:hypothetical protein